MDIMYSGSQVECLSFVTLPNRSNRNAQDSVPGGFNYGKVTQQFQGSEVHPISSVKRERKSNLPVQRWLTTPPFRSIFDVVNNQRARMNHFDRTDKWSLNSIPSSANCVAELN